jgi:hypothetical protein
MIMPKACVCSATVVHPSGQSVTTQLDVHSVAKLHPFYLQAPQKLSTVHDRTHTEDPAAFANMQAGISGQPWRTAVPECLSCLKL